MNILQRVVRGLQHSTTGKSGDDLPEQIDSLLNQVKVAFNQLKSLGKTAFIVIDGLDKVLKQKATEMVRTNTLYSS